MAKDHLPRPALATVVYGHSGVDVGFVAKTCYGRGFLECKEKKNPEQRLERRCKEKKWITCPPDKLEVNMNTEWLVFAKTRELTITTVDTGCLLEVRAVTSTMPLVGIQMFIVDIRRLLEEVGGETCTFVFREGIICPYTGQRSF